MDKTFAHLAGAAAATLVTFCCGIVADASAQTPQTADAMYDGFLKAYEIGSGNNSYFAVSFANRDESFQWQEAYLISGVEDAYDRNKGADRQAFIAGLMARYDYSNFTHPPYGPTPSTNLNWDGYNDDAAWATLALSRAFQITANQLFLTEAGNVWNNAYSRGWDTQLGGGIWETSPVDANDSKCTLSNLSFIPSGVILYQATGNATYLTRMEAIYAWTRAHLFNTSTGQMNECDHPTTGVVDDTNVYNSGLMVNAASEMYRLTGNLQYYNDALLAADFTVNKYTIMTPDYIQNGPFGGDQFFRGLSNFARQNGLWSKYATWFHNNATDAWNNRRTDYNITHNDLATPTPTTGSSNMSSMEMASAMILEQVTQIPDIVSPPTFSGHYELENSSSGQALSVSGGSTERGVAVVQEPYTGASSELWTITATSGGYYQIQNANSGLYLNVGGASILDGAGVIQWSAQAIHPGNDEWMPVNNGDGTYSFFNLNSHQVLDNYRASKSAGNQFDQWVANGSSAQKFTLIAR